MVALGLVPWAGTANAAAVFTVNTNGDGSDQDTADNVCDVDTATAGLQCSLRAAIQQANVLAGADTVQFNIPGAGAHRIKPASQLPSISQPLTINGYSQPGATVNTAADGTNANILIGLDGRNAFGGADGLIITGGSSVVRGLAINNFQEAGSSDGFGIFLPNLAPNTGNIIRGNFIGTNLGGTAAEPNDGTAIATFGASTGNVIGGSTPATVNLLSGSSSNGMTLDSNGNSAQGNLIGTDKTGTSDLGNSRGIVISGGSNNTIGGNTIAFNFGPGVDVFSGTGNLIGANSIFLNDGQGIDLGNNGRTLNDLGTPPDTDTGPNNLQNFPVLARSKTTSGGVTTVSLSLQSAPNADFTIRFFRGPPGTSQGTTFVEADMVHTDANGNFFNSVFTLTHTVPAGQSLTATATDAGKNTSEFSDPVLVRSAP